MGAKFRFLGTERGICFIEDLDQGISITNDAENVWRRVLGGSVYPAIKNTRLVYKDTQSEWWEMIPTFDDNHKPNNWKIEFKRWHGHVWDALNA